MEEAPQRAPGDEEVFAGFEGFQLSSLPLFSVPVETVEQAQVEKNRQPGRDFDPSLFDAALPTHDKCPRCSSEDLSDVHTPLDFRYIFTPDGTRKYAFKPQVCLSCDATLWPDSYSFREQPDDEGRVKKFLPNPTFILVGGHFGFSASVLSTWTRYFCVAGTAITAQAKVYNQEMARGERGHGRCVPVQHGTIRFDHTMSTTIANHGFKMGLIFNVLKKHPALADRLVVPDGCSTDEVVGALLRILSNILPFQHKRCGRPDCIYRVGALVLDGNAKFHRPTCLHEGCLEQPTKSTVTGHEYMHCVRHLSEERPPADEPAPEGKVTRKQTGGLFFGVSPCTAIIVHGEMWHSERPTSFLHTLPALLTERGLRSLPALVYDKADVLFQHLHVQMREMNNAQAFQREFGFWGHFITVAGEKMTWRGTYFLLDRFHASKLSVKKSATKGSRNKKRKQGEAEEEDGADQQDRSLPPSTPSSASSSAFTPVSKGTWVVMPPPPPGVAGPSTANGKAPAAPAAEAPTLKHSNPFALRLDDPEIPAQFKVINSSACEQINSVVNRSRRVLSNCGGDLFQLALWVFVDEHNRSQATSINSIE